MSVRGCFSWGLDCTSTVKGEKESERVIEEAGRKIDSLTTLKEIDLQVKRGELICIIGELGSGKSSLLSSIIGEMIYLPRAEIDLAGDRVLSMQELKAMHHAVLNDHTIGLDEPPIKIGGEISYVEQQAWI